jgi:hypothetical protein
MQQTNNQVLSRCCRAEILILPGNNEGECARCGSPSCRITDEEDICLFEDSRFTNQDFNRTEKLYLMGMQRAAKETSKMYIW